MWEKEKKQRLTREDGSGSEPNLEHHFHQLKEIGETVMRGQEDGEFRAGVNLFDTALKTRQPKDKKWEGTPQEKGYQKSSRPQREAVKGQRKGVRKNG